ncbi:Nn.00g017320.m01.CDS01 [Neocucurbitaria sp. VM-36]
MLSSPATLTYTIRSLQGVLSATTIGLAVVLITDQSPGASAALNYGLAVGVISLLGAVVGVLALWLPILQGLILLLTDISVQVMNLAGGLVFAIKLEGVDCLNQSMAHMQDTLIHISLLNGDCPTEELHYKCHTWDEGDGVLQRRCRWATTAAVVMFVNFIVVLVGVLVEYIGGRGRVRK